MQSKVIISEYQGVLSPAGVIMSHIQNGTSVCDLPVMSPSSNASKSISTRKKLAKHPAGEEFSSLIDTIRQVSWGSGGAGRVLVNRLGSFHARHVITTAARNPRG